MNNEKFDNFTKLRSAFNKSNATVPFRVYTRLEGGARSYDLYADLIMQLFWSCYFEPYGEDFLRQRVESIKDPATKDLALCCLDNISDFIDAEVDNFYDFMDNIAGVDFNLPEFHREIPVFGINNIHHFIKDYRYRRLDRTV